MQTEFFELSTTAPPEWSIVGPQMIDCLRSHRDESTGLIHIERTGPCAPPVALASMDEFVVTQDFRNWISESCLGQFEFKPVVKDRVIEINWHLWDTDSDTDISIPRDCDPEAYLMDLPHSANAAAELGELWEWIIAPGGVRELVPRADKPFLFDRWFHTATWNGADIFRAGIEPNDFAGKTIVTRRAMESLLGKWPKYLTFRECPVR